MDRLSFLKNNLLIILVITFSLVSFLSYSDPWENFFLVAFSLVSLMLVRRLIKDISIEKALITLGISIIGYILIVVILLSQGYKMELGSKHTNNEREDVAVLLVYMGENPMYDMSLEINNILLEGNMFDKLKTPFKLHTIKSKYKDIGKSNYKKNTYRVQQQLQNLLSDKNKVYTGYLYDSKYVEERLIDIVNDGYHKIIVAPIFLTEGSYLDVLKTRIDKMKLFNLNIQIRFTEPLWYSENVVDCYLEKIMRNVDKGNLMDTGIVLIGQNEKGYNEDEFIESVKENLIFRKKVKDYLVNSVGFHKDKVRLGWLENIDPEYPREIKSLLEYGVDEILCIYVKPQVTYIENYDIVEEIKEEVKLPDEVNVKLIDGFLNDSIFVYELRNKVEIEKLKDWN